MLFNSFVFLVFAAFFFAVWSPAKQHFATRCWFLVASSFLFYGWWDWRFILLIIASGLIDFTAALGMEAFPRWRKALLWLSLLANVGSLAVFKYLDFFIANVNAVTDLLGTNQSVPAANLILPVGISFYTFQSMSYTIDVYRGELKATKSLGQFFAYLSMFPQLVAGPIVRARDVLPAIAEQKTPTKEDWWIGLRWIIHGYFKKMVIADNLAPLVDAAFSSSTVVESCSYWWFVMIMFSLQIYCDFSGYSDIARGLGKWMGYDFPENFRHPYIAQGFRDFWGRWHISLSTWFRDYVYIPLGGSRTSEPTAHFNMWVTMLISGFWHGASWTFVVWGGLHALLLSVERILVWPRLCRMIVHPVVGGAVAALLTYMAVCITWVFFRADSLAQAVEITYQLGNFRSLNLSHTLSSFKGLAKILVLAMFFREAFFFLKLEQTKFFHSRLFDNSRVVFLATIIVLTILFRGPGQTFVYFQF